MVQFTAKKWSKQMYFALIAQKNPRTWMARGLCGGWVVKNGVFVLLCFSLLEF